MVLLIFYDIKAQLPKFGPIRFDLGCQMFVV